MAVLLGVNVDHVATVRQARGTNYPSVLDSARLAERAGADSITIHLREDRRHIQDADVGALINGCATRINLELAVTSEMLDIALAHRPADVCLVPEKRAELTTEGGLDVVAHRKLIASAISQLGGSGIRVSLFIDPEPVQLRMASEIGAPVVELHTGAYAEALGAAQLDELKRLRTACELGHELGLQINAGHGLHYQNTVAVAALPFMTELNIGHAIVARAIFVGLDQAVREMKALMRTA